MSSKPSTNFAIWFSRPISFKNISFYLSVCKIIVFVRDHQIYCEPLKWIIWNYFAHCLGKWGFNSPQNDILKANKQLHNVPHCEPHSKDECLTTYSIFTFHFSFFLFWIKAIFKCKIFQQICRIKFANFYKTQFETEAEFT